MLIDSHCHLNDPKFENEIPEIIARAADAGVTRIICAGYDLKSSGTGVKIAREHNSVFATVGVHPHDARTFNPEVEREIREMAQDRKHVVAIGEAGLDYHYDLSPRDVQRDVFRKHIQLARELDLPLVVHSREASADTLSILMEGELPAKGVVMHCLPSDGNLAQGAMELGCFAGIAGPVTFQNARHLREIVSGLPIDRLLLETDAPYLTPHPHRGMRNEPSYLPLVARQVAELKGLTFEEVAEFTSANTRRLYGEII